MYQNVILLGIILALVYTELTGLPTGGLVSAGYLALAWMQPERILLTLLLSLASFAVVRLLDQVLILYGKRRFAVCVLVGAALSVVFRWFPVAGEVRAIGFLVPGLIASDMVRGGVVRTLTGLASVTLVLVLVLFGCAG